MVSVDFQFFAGSIDSEIEKRTLTEKDTLTFLRDETNCFYVDDGRYLN